MSVNEEKSNISKSSDIDEKQSLNHVNSIDDDWRSTFPKLTDKLGFALSNGIITDVTFIVGKQKCPIQAHRVILSLTSSVFNAMFYGSLAQLSDTIEIPDIEPISFRNMLNFLYTNEMDLNFDSVIDTLYAARKYLISPLEEVCVNFLENTLTVDNAFFLLSQAVFLDLNKLIAACLKVIDKDTEKCFNSNSFLDIDTAVLKMVLSRDSLQVEEIILYDAVIKWSQAECLRNNLPTNSSNQLSVLKECAKLIRYPLMKKEEFVARPSQDGLLTADQQLEFFKLPFLISKCTSEFAYSPRFDVGDKQIVCNRFNSISQKPFDTSKLTGISFTSDQDIFIIGFGLYGSNSRPAEYNVRIRLFRSNDITKIASNKYKFSSDGTPQPFLVKFKVPVKITAKNSYYVTMMINGPKTYLGMGGQETVYYLNGKRYFTFRNVNNVINSSIYEGQIPQIIFYE